MRTALFTLASNRLILLSDGDRAMRYSQRPAGTILECKQLAGGMGGIMKWYAACAVILLASLSTGCATIIEGTTQTVGVTTSSVSGASCTLVNERGSWSLTSPGKVVVKRSTTDLVITCKKEGWQDTTGRLISHTSDGTSATALLWGPIGVGVDAASGASFHYAPSIDLPMTAVAPPAPVAAPAAPAVPVAAPAP